MSAWIVSKKHIDVIVTALLAYGSSTPGNEEGFPSNIDEATKLGKKLWSMNHNAVNQRYDKKYKPEVYEFTSSPASLIQVIKAMHSLHYQCSEGDVPNTKLYKWLEKTTSWLESQYVSNTPEYDNAEWAL